jgi:adenine deaminase
MEVDVLIRDIKYFNSSMKYFEKGHVAIVKDKFLYVGNNDNISFSARHIIEGENRFMIPGLIDIHLHIESSMVTPHSFSYGVIRNGVTTIVEDPHEMANVFGLEGVEEMIKASENCVVDIFHGIPSSVPATPFETTGGEIDIFEIDRLLMMDNVICLGEIMNYTEVITDKLGKTNRLLKHVRENYPDLVIEGHCPKLMDLALSKFIFSGIDSDHTHQSVEGLKDRIRQGMFIEIQEKSMIKDVIQYLIENDCSEHFCFVTDDVMPDSFIEKGHLNHLVKKAIQMGMKPENAIYAATKTPANRMRLYDRGQISTKKIADFIILDDLENFSIDQVFKNGQKVYDRAVLYEEEIINQQFPNAFYHSVKMNVLSKADLLVNVPIQEGEITCRIIEVINGSTFTECNLAKVEVKDHLLNWRSSDYCLISVFERYGKNNNRAFGLVGGDTIKRGAIATTYVHDHHNLLAFGKNEEDILLAANTVIQHQGGICVVLNGEILSFLPLPVGGILSEDSLDKVGTVMRNMRKSIEYLGYQHYNPIMSLSTMGLAVSPALKITDIGLVDVNEGKLVSLFSTESCSE